MRGGTNRTVGGGPRREKGEGRYSGGQQGDRGGRSIPETHGRLLTLVIVVPIYWTVGARVDLDRVAVWCSTDDLDFIPGFARVPAQFI